MDTALFPVRLSPLHPAHAILLGFPFPFFLAAFLSDIAYSNTFQIQWANLASWLVAGGLLGGGFALLWTSIDLFRFRGARTLRPLLYFGLLLAMWLVGFVNALVHAKDAWATMPEGLYLSSLITLLGLAAAWIGYSGFPFRGVA